MTTISLRALNPALRELARTNCNENPNTVVDHILIIKEWIEKSPHLRASTDPQLILAFLRRCRFSLEETKRRIDDYYALKNAFPEVLCERELCNDLMEFYRSGVHIVHNKPVTPDGPVLMISQYCKIDSRKSNPCLAFKLLFILFEVLAIESDNASIVGLTYVIDCLDVGIDLMMQFDPFLLKKAYTLAENFMPLKLKDVHILNMRREGFPIFNFVTSFMPSTLAFKLTAHKEVEDLLEYISPDAVTIEYGGDNGHISEAVESFEQKLLAYKKHFLEDVHFGTNEDLRDGRKKEWKLGELRGVSGSFRKLELD